MRNTFIRCLTKLAERDERVYLITADMGFSVLEGFREQFPDRLLNVGIAEQNAVSVACGLALSGKIVYVYSIIPFVTMRCFEQVRVDVAYMNTNVRLVGVGAGLSYGPAGATHHATEDIAVMRALPNMTVCCPGDPVETREIVMGSLEHRGPMYIRLGKNGEPNIHPEDLSIPIGKSIQVTEGKDLLLITTSNMLEEGKKWVQHWEAKGKQITLLSMPTVKPLDCEAILPFINQSTPIVTLEEHNIIGGLGSAVAELIAESGKAVKFTRLGIPDIFIPTVGSHSYLRDKYILQNLYDITV